MSLSEIVNVSITRETRAITAPGFGTLLILGPNANFNARLQFATTLSSVADMLAGGTSAEEYTAAQKAFSQNPRVERIAIGHQRGTKTLTDNDDTFTGGTIKTTVNGVLVSTAWATSKDDTLTAHAAAIQDLDAVSTAVYNSVAHTIVITPAAGEILAVVGDTSSITGNMTWTLSATATEDIADALGNIQIENDDWYALKLTSRAEQDVLDAADWIEAQSKILFYSSDDADIIDVSAASDTASLAAVTKANGYARTIGLYSGVASTMYSGAAYAGKLLPYDPGTYTAKFKTLSGITVDNLTATQSTNARDKNINVYENIGGVSITREGVVAEGEFIDTIVFVDWLTANITTDVYGLLVRSKKLPYTLAGMEAIKSVIEKRLQIGLNRGGISPFSLDEDGNQNGGYVVTLPAFSEIAIADKAARLLQDIKFTAWLAGAIHAVKIDGTVTL